MFGLRSRASYACFSAIVVSTCALVTPETALAGSTAAINEAYYKSVVQGVQTGDFPTIILRPRPPDVPALRNRVRELERQLLQLGDGLQRIIDDLPDDKKEEADAIVFILNCISYFVRNRDSPDEEPQGFLDLGSAQKDMEASARAVGTQLFGASSIGMVLINRMIATARQFQEARAEFEAANRAFPGQIQGLSVEPSGLGTRIGPVTVQPTGNGMTPHGWIPIFRFAATKFKNDDAADTDGMVTSIAAGAARKVAENLTIGTFLSFRHVDSDTRIFLSSFDMDFLGGGLLVQLDLPAGFAFNATAVYERGWVDSVLALDTAKFAIDAVSLRGELSRRFSVTPNWWLQPTVAVEYSSFRIGGFTDSGGTVNAASTSEHGRLSFGARLGRSLPVYWGAVERVDYEGEVLGLYDFLRGGNQTVTPNTSTAPDHGAKITKQLNVRFEGGASAGFSASSIFMNSDFRAYSASLHINVPLEHLIGGGSRITPAGGAPDAESGLPVDFTGSYAGVSFGHGSSDIRLTNLNTGATSGEFGVNGLVAGVVSGFNYQFAAGDGSPVLGVETEFMFTDIDGDSRAAVCGLSRCTTDIESLALAKGRAGFTAGPFLPYVAVGVALADVDGNFNVNQGPSKYHWGFVIGGGIECACGDGWRIGLDYSYVDLETRKHTLNNIPYRFDPDALHLVRASIKFETNVLGLLR